MDQDDRFKPPKSVVADVGSPARRSLVAPIVLALASLFHLDWVWINARGIVRMVSAGALSPIGLTFAVVGLACLYVGLALAVLKGYRGGRALLIATVCLGITWLTWHELSLDSSFPIVFGITLAIAGWILVRAHLRQLARHPDTDGVDR